MTSSRVLKALEHHLIRDEYRPSGLLIPEVQAPGSDRRADAIWMTARTAHITGYEIKVTRADLLSELRDPTKCEPWLKYCDRWWLAVGDASIVDGLMDQIPADWGVCTPPTSANRRMMTVLKEAPVLTPANKGPVLGKLISHQAYRNADLRRRAEVADGQVRRHREQQDARAEWEVKEIQRRANPHEEAFRKVGDAFKQLQKDRGSWGSIAQVPPETVAKAILHMHEIGKLTDDIARRAESQLRNMDRAITGVTGSSGWKELQETLKGIIGDGS